MAISARIIFCRRRLRLSPPIENRIDSACVYQAPHATRGASFYHVLCPQDVDASDHVLPERFRSRHPVRGDVEHDGGSIQRRLDIRQRADVADDKLGPYGSLGLIPEGKWRHLPTAT